MPYLATAEHREALRSRNQRRRRRPWIAVRCDGSRVRRAKLVDFRGGIEFGEGGAGSLGR